MLCGSFIRDSSLFVMISSYHSGKGGARTN
nr:MAG TPA: hypothetical protein [Phage sp. ctucZ11]